MQHEIRAILDDGVRRTDAALDRLLPSPEQEPQSIHRAMCHSVFAGGKRLRPVLCMEAARMIAGGNEYPPGVEDLGSAIEMIHTYSLIHDDLPALDNDDLRRGKPTCHVVFGEAIAILAGDALQTRAYQVLADLPCAPERVVAILKEIAAAIGTVAGMIGGQVLDLEGEVSKPTADSVLSIHRAKTGALIRASVVAGGLFAGASPADTERLTGFGQSAGLAFQIIDDVLDRTQPSAELGKTAGKDVASEKATWPAVFGMEQSRRDAEQLIAKAFAYLEPYGSRAEPLKLLAQFLVERTH